MGNTADFKNQTNVSRGLIYLPNGSCNITRGQESNTGTCDPTIKSSAEHGTLWKNVST